MGYLTGGCEPWLKGERDRVKKKKPKKKKFMKKQNMFDKNTMQETRKVLDRIFDTTLVEKLEVSIDGMRNIFRAFFQMEFSSCSKGSKGSMIYARKRMSIARELTDMKQEVLLGKEEKQVKEFKNNVFEFFDLEFDAWKDEQTLKERLNP